MARLFFPALVLDLVATGVSAQEDARYADGGDNTHYGWADVLRVDPVYGVARTEVPQQGHRRECLQVGNIHGRFLTVAIGPGV